MKATYLLLLSVILFSCSESKLEKTVKAKAFTGDENFNTTPNGKKDILTFSKVDSSNVQAITYNVKYRDTVIVIQNDPKPIVSIFKQPRFLNTQKTAAIVQVADSSGLVAPYYIISSRNGQIEVTKLDRPSSGANDSKITKGLEELSLSIFLLNNDYVVTIINGRVYPVKRQNDAERIQGRFILYSEDKTTLVFATKTTLYQTNYKTGESVDLKVNEKLLAPENMANFNNNFTWYKNANGTSFLKESDPDKIVDLSEFK
ncbi:hypothetical protein QWY86_06490 [Pedobacter aquatilis]|uniref:hypothetical protein n=1 Tax=Pedobacter aquatilis TaxID=351343 RepID=UPI0025B47B61|nr:hypothetical protein [Pedobacter aquatilis]MDN3586308.1 hypothetical protein [Pedobacter aquatilis]